MPSTLSPLLAATAMVTLSLWTASAAKDPPHASPPHSSTRVRMEPDLRVSTVSTRGWTRAGRCISADEIELLFMLRHGEDQVAELEATLYAVSDPESPRYGQHLTREEVRSLTATHFSRLCHTPFSPICHTP